MKVRLADLIEESIPIALTHAELRILVRPRLNGALSATVRAPAIQFESLTGLYRGRGSSELGSLRIQAGQARLIEAKLTPGDERKFLMKMREEVLETSAWPEIRFHVERVDSAPPRDWGGHPGANPRYVRDPNAPLETRDEDLVITGSLEIRAVRRPMELRLRQVFRHLFRCEVGVDMRDFGIPPPRAFLGAIRIEPVLPVEIEIDLRGVLHVEEADFTASSSSIPD